MLAIGAPELKSFLPIAIQRQWKIVLFHGMWFSNATLLLLDSKFGGIGTLNQKTDSIYQIYHQGVAAWCLFLVIVIISRIATSGHGTANNWHWLRTQVIQNATCSGQNWKIHMEFVFNADKYSWTTKVSQTLGLLGGIPFKSICTSHIWVQSAVYDVR